SVSGLTAVVDDPSPHLGGDLNVSGKRIVSDSDGDVVIMPDGNGSVVCGGYIIEKTKSITVNPASTEIFEIYDVAKRSIYVDYLFISPNGSRSGTLFVITDTNNVSIVDTCVDVGTVGIDFTAAVNAGNIELSYTESNSDSG